MSAFASTVYQYMCFAFIRTWGLASLKFSTFSFVFAWSDMFRPAVLCFSFLGFDVSVLFSWSLEGLQGRTDAMRARKKTARLHGLSQVCWASSSWGGQCKVAMDNANRRKSNMFKEKVQKTVRHRNATASRNCHKKLQLKFYQYQVEIFREPCPTNTWCAYVREGRAQGTRENRRKETWRQIEVPRTLEWKRKVSNNWSKGFQGKMPE